jgi:tetratricopeptide (TPR) repeat protein
MTKKEFLARKKQIRSLIENDDHEEAIETAIDLISELHDEKEFEKIVELYLSKFIQPKSYLYTFEVAYALVNQNRESDAEPIYEYIVSIEPKNSAALNNLSNIKKGQGKIEEAFDLIERAYEIEQNDEIVSRNYNNLNSKFREIEEINLNFKYALTYLEKENEFVIGKLKNFISNIKKEKEYRDNKIPIPKWKFKMLMGTDEQKSISLLDQWLDKGYLKKTGNRGHYNELEYEINPFLENALENIKPTKINESWLSGINNLNIEQLEDLSYFEIEKRVNKVKKSIRVILKRDVDELYVNLIMGNYKSVVIMAGSIVEVLLIYYCEKKKYSTIAYQRHNKTISKKIYESDLGDLITFIEQNKLLGNVLVHMANISRLYRNYVHPGKELRESEELNDSKANLCFISTVEIIKKICT